MAGLTNCEAHHVHLSVPLSVCQLLCVVVLLHKEEEEAREDGKDKIHTDIYEWHGAQAPAQEVGLPEPELATSPSSSASASPSVSPSAAESRLVRGARGDSPQTSLIWK